MEIGLLARGSKASVYSLETGGRRSFLKWQREAEISFRTEWAQLMRRIATLAVSGPSSNPAHFRKVQGYELWEIETKSLRLLYFQDGHDLCLVTIGFEKPGGQLKVQRQFFEMAQDLRDQYLHMKKLGLVTRRED